MIDEHPNVRSLFEKSGRVVLRMWDEPENEKWPGVFKRLLNYYD